MEITIPNWLVALAVVVHVAYFWGRWTNSFFSRKGVRALSGAWPLVGNMLKVLIRKEHFKDPIEQAYNAFPEDRYVGYMQFVRPVLLIKDLELVKQVTVKDFDSFQDHFGIIDEESDPLFGRNLFGLKGEIWRDMRATLSPAFTSSKMRSMFDFVVECGEQMANFFLEELEKPENKGQEYLTVEMKDSFTRYTNDVIATSAFGLKVDSLKDRDNEFFTMGKRATDFSGTKQVKCFGYLCFPKLMKWLKITVFDADVSAFFRNLVASTMRTREENGILRPDMIQLLMEARRGTLRHEGAADAEDTGFATVQESALGKQLSKRKWTDDDLIAQAMLFFAAGFETASTVLCFMAHELMVHPEVQRRLQEEVDSVAARCGGKVTYTELNAMKYMDMVVSEALRLWPPVVAIDRVCLKPYTLPPPREGGKPFTIQTDGSVWLPIAAIHHDPRYYKNPMTFDPERFSDANKGSIDPLSFVPFGFGPRNCIGSRFALMKLKAVIFHLLAKFDFVITEKSDVPIQIALNTFNMQAKNGFWIGLKKRSLNPKNERNQ